MLNTLKTIVGYFGAVLKKHTPIAFGGDNVEDVYNYLQIDERLATSGQPTEQQFQQIREAGYGTVINLAPTSVLENSLVEEAAVLDALGVRYVHIPVDFKAPTERDFQQFVAAMNAASDEKVWVHCAANMRVSAFVFRYRCEIRGEDRNAARADLETLWEPFGVWRAFIEGRAPSH